MAREQKTDRSGSATGFEIPSTLGKTKEDWIGNQLKRVYDEALHEQIPDDMLALLNQLDSGSNSAPTSQRDQVSKKEESAS